MGEVFKARDTPLDREDPCARFEREARALASLAMEYTDGETLAGRVSELLQSWNLAYP